MRQNYPPHAENMEQVSVNYRNTSRAGSARRERHCYRYQYGYIPSILLLSRYGTGQYPRPRQAQNINLSRFWYKIS